MGWLNYHHLYYFHVIAREGSIAKASRILLIGQSALSIQLKQLEEFLEIRLFKRKSQRLILTESGDLVLKYANAIFGLGTEMLEAISENRSASSIRLDIGVLDSVPKSVAHQLVKKAMTADNCYVWL